MKKLSMIILDLGGVIFKEPEHSILDILPEDVRKQFPSDFPRMRVFLRAFDFANVIANQDLKMPWLFGTLSGTEVARTIHEHIDIPTYASFFKTEHERLLIKHGASMMFEPNQLARWSTIYPEALTFATRCKQAGMRLFILSNWDPESFRILKELHPEFFGLFADSDIFIPHIIGHAKPDVKAYEYIIKNKNVDPAQVIFIDDSKTNIQVAQEYGLSCILHTDWLTTIQAFQEQKILA